MSISRQLRAPGGGYASRTTNKWPEGSSAGTTNSVRTWPVLVILTLACSLVPALPAWASAGLSGKASASGFPVGVAIYDFATLGNASNPSGTITFTLFGPDDVTCSGSPLFTSTKSVSANGNYESDRFTSTVAGDYRWIAAFSGNATEPPLRTECDDPAQVVSVGRRTPTLTGQPSPSVAMGRPASKSAALSGAGPSGPTGTMTFNLYGPDNMVCSGAPRFTSTKAVAGNGTYTSDPYVFTATGRYQWVVGYSGDGNNFAASSICSEPSAVLIVNRGDRAVYSSDFDGDKTSDVAVYRPGGFWYVSKSGGGSTVVNWGSSEDMPASADYDGDGKTDFGVFRPSSATWYIARSTGGTTVLNWGLSSDIPMPGDYDGDRKDDVAVYRPSTGVWYISRSAGGTTVTNWGSSGDIPASGDFDGDGKNDLAVFRPSSATWYIARSTGGTTVMNWGLASDVPQAGDYDGDGKTDIAVFRPLIGVWYISLSAGGVTVTNWGSSGDIATTGDFDGDRISDLTVFRPSSAKWYISLSNGGSTVINWGASGDIPIGPPPAAN